MRFGQPSRKSGLAGFTLLELLVVMSIISMLMLVGYSTLHPGGEERRLRLLAQTLQVSLMRARSNAISSGKTVDVFFNLDDRSWQFTDGDINPLPKEVSIRLVASNVDAGDEQHIHVLFFPDGSSTGGDIQLAVGSERTSFHVDWLTGSIDMDGE